MRRELYQSVCATLLVIVWILVGFLVYNHYNADAPIWKDFMSPDATRADTAHVRHRTSVR